MKCPKCQAENPEEAEFCSLCYARFQVQTRSSSDERAVQEAMEKNKGSKLRCPSCNDLSPLDSPFCLKCGFVLDDIEAIMVSEEEIERISREKDEASKQQMEVLLQAPIIVTAESDGAEVLRNIEEILDKGYHACIHTHGRNATTYAMKLIALMGEDFRKRDKDVFFRANLITEGTITDLDDVELEIVLETR